MTDDDVRLHIYRRFVEDARPPSVTETSASLGVSRDDVAASYRRLADGHVIVLEPGSLDVWMANPLSARSTPFQVRTEGGREYYAPCVWDAPGVLAVLEADGTVDTECPDCATPLRLEVRDGDLVPAEAVAHFAVPARRWWDDIGFT